jgi:CBS domain-containing protein
MSIRDLLQNRKPLVTVDVDAMVAVAVERMAEADIGAVLVMDEGEIVGIFTERDCLQKVARKSLSTAITPLRQVMTSNVRYATHDQSVEDCMRLMTERYFRHLPVLDEHGTLLGIVSIGDLVKARLSEQKFVIEQMEHYIADSLPVTR